MEVSGVARAFGALSLALGAAALVFCGAAALVGAGELALAFLISSGASVFLGGALRLASRGRAPRGGAREGVVTLISAWVLAPLLAAPPLLTDQGLLGAYADAVSAVTTSGFWPRFIPSTPGPDGALSLDVVVQAAWWNVLQWAGGFASIVSALVVLAAVNLTGPGVHRSTLFTLRPDELFDRFAPIGRAVAMLYSAVTVGVWIAAWIGGAGFADAGAVAMAAVSTGGLVTSAGAGGPIPVGAALAACVGMAFGALNFSLHWDLVRTRADTGYHRDDETLALVGFAGVIAAACAFAVHPAPSDRALAAVEGAALAWTAGWDLGAGGASGLAPTVIMAIVLIGGASISTAGGLKVIRLILLFRHVGAELRRLAHPSSVGSVRYRDRTLEPRAVLGLLLYAVGYTGAVALAAFAFAGAGLSFPDALAAAVGAIANAGAAYPMMAADAGAPLLGDARALIGSVAMILGRVEILAALAVLAPSFWGR